LEITPATTASDIHSIHGHDRVHFFAVGARIMRRILVDHARSKGNAKHGGGGIRIDFNESLVSGSVLSPKAM
jgi:RNA polymerase sigma-70 factor, ECF subfamily